VTTISEQLDLAGEGWRDAWRYEQRGAHGEWVKGLQDANGPDSPAVKHLASISEEDIRAASFKTPSRGIQGDTRILTLPGGEKVIDKTLKDFDTGERMGHYIIKAQDMADAEELGYYVSQAIGAGAPPVQRRSPTRILTGYVAGKTGSQWAAARLQKHQQEEYKDWGIDTEIAEKHAYDSTVVDQLGITHSPQGELIGVLDFLISNRDRNPGNFLIFRNRPVPIDHSSSSFDAEDPASDFTDDNDILRQTWPVAEWGPRLRALEPQFARMGRQAQYASMMHQFARLKPAPAQHSNITGQALELGWLGWQHEARNQYGEWSTDPLGDLKTARHVITYVPGVGSDKPELRTGEVERATRIKAIANVMAHGDSTAVAVFGYDSPDTIPAGLEHEKGLAAAKKLAAFQKKLMSENPYAHFTVVGHSYGSYVASQAAKLHGMKPDDLVFIGSPGTGARHASELGMPQGHVWAGAERRDLIPRLATLISPDLKGNPVHPAYGANVFAADAPLKLEGTDRLHSEAHGSYFLPGSMALPNIGAITTGDYGKVIKPWEPGSLAGYNELTEKFEKPPATVAASNITTQALEFAGWADAWRTELRGPNGEWISGPEHNDKLLKAATGHRASAVRLHDHVLYGKTELAPGGMRLQTRLVPMEVTGLHHHWEGQGKNRKRFTDMELKDPVTGETTSESVKDGNSVKMYRREDIKAMMAAEKVPAEKPAAAEPASPEGPSKKAMDEARRVVDPAGMSPEEHEAVSRELARNYDMMPAMIGKLKTLKLDPSISSYAAGISTPNDGIRLAPSTVHNMGLTQRDYEAREASGFYVRGDDENDHSPISGLRHLITHEFGHAVTWTQAGKLQISPEVQRAMAKAISGQDFPATTAGTRAAWKVLNDKRKTTRAVSGYGSSNWAELAAEAYAAWSLGDTGTAGKVGDSFVHMLDQVPPTSCDGLPLPGHAHQHASITGQALELAGGWRDAWLHEARGPHGEWIKGSAGVLQFPQREYKVPPHERLINQRSPYHDPADHPFFKKYPVSHVNIEHAFDLSSPGQREQGMRWYPDAGLVSTAMAHGDSHLGAGLLSAFSPQTAWPVNMFNAARSVELGRPIQPHEGTTVMGQQSNAAQKIFDGVGYDEALPGPKTNAFAHLIENDGLDDPDDPYGRVVVDRHAVSVAAGQRVSDMEAPPIGDDRYYQHIADEYRKAAINISKREGRMVTPSQLQAITWLVQQAANEAEDAEMARQGLLDPAKARLAKGRVTRTRNAWANWMKYAGQHDLQVAHGTTALSMLRNASLDELVYRDMPTTTDLAAWEHELRDTHGRWIREITVADLHPGALVPGKAGSSRPVSREEFRQIASRGLQRLAEISKTGSGPLTGLDRNWGDIKAKTFVEVQQPWGGATIDAHTGEELPQGADRYALTVKPTGMTAVSVPEHATEAEFSAAMDQALAQFRTELEKGSRNLGIFHDDDNHRIDIDPVLVVDSHDDVESVGAYTHAIGGAYHFQSGDGFWPPHIEEAQEHSWHSSRDQDSGGQPLTLSSQVSAPSSSPKSTQPLTITAQMTDLSWKDAWRTERRGPHGEWTKGTPDEVTPIVGDRILKDRDAETDPVTKGMLTRALHEFEGNGDGYKAARHLENAAARARSQGNEDKAAHFHGLAVSARQHPPPKVNPNEGYPGEFSEKIRKYWRNEINDEARDHLNRASSAWDAGLSYLAASELRKAADTSGDLVDATRYSDLADRIHSASSVAAQEQKTAHEYLAKAQPVVMSVVGGKSNWSGQVGIFDQQNRPTIAGMAFTDGHIELSDAVVENLRSVTGHKGPVGTSEAYDLMVPLHEMIHQEGMTPDDDAAYRSGSAAQYAEEGFTQLGTALHAPEFFDKLGLGKRGVSNMVAMGPLGIPVDDPQFLRAAHKFTADMQAQWAKMTGSDNPEVRRAADNLGRDIEEIKHNPDQINYLTANDDFSGSLSQIQHLGDSDLSVWAQGMRERLTKIQEMRQEKLASLHEYAVRMSDPGRIMDSNSWGSYDNQTRLALKWAQDVAHAEGIPTDTSSTILNDKGRKRVMELVDEINRVGSAQKFHVMAQQLLRAEKLPVKPPGADNIGPGLTTFEVGDVKADIQNQFEPSGEHGWGDPYGAALKGLDNRGLI
jgi:pimeloyl-ACP methyl ester carboxylesterase